MLKYKEKTIREVDYRDLDKFISKEYGREFEFIPTEEWSNSESHSFDVKKEELDEWELEDLEEFKSTGKSDFITGLLLKDLCNRDRLPEGEYLIDIFW